MTTGADGTSTSMKYDDVARTATSTDAEGYMQIATYDKWGKGIKTEEKTQLDQVLRILEKTNTITSAVKRWSKRTATATSPLSGMMSWVCFAK